MSKTSELNDSNVLAEISSVHKKTGGKCGIGLVQLSLLLEINMPSLKIILNKLFKENKILIREGINHKLIFIRP